MSKENLFVIKTKKPMSNYPVYPIQTGAVITHITHIKYFTQRNSLDDYIKWCNDIGYEIISAEHYIKKEDIIKRNS